MMCDGFKQLGILLLDMIRRSHDKSTLNLVIQPNGPETIFHTCSNEQKLATLSDVYVKLLDRNNSHSVTQLSNTVMGCVYSFCFWQIKRELQTKRPLTRKSFRSLVYGTYIAFYGINKNYSPSDTSLDNWVWLTDKVATLYVYDKLTNGLGELSVPPYDLELLPLFSEF